MSERVRVYLGEKLVHDTEYEDGVKLFHKRKVTPLYRKGEDKPFTLAPSIRTEFIISGIPVERPTVDIITDDADPIIYNNIKKLDLLG